MEFSSDSGAIFSTDRKERFVLWRNWDNTKPKVLFIGLNPSTANEQFNDPTTKRIITHSKRLGFGGCFLMNCFSQITTDPKQLNPSRDWQQNLKLLNLIAPISEEVIFAWGKHPLVKQLGRDVFFENRFSKAKCLGNNLDGSPKHPLYLPYSLKLRKFSNERDSIL